MAALTWEDGQLRREWGYPGGNKVGPRDAQVDSGRWLPLCSLLAPFSSTQVTLSAGLLPLPRSSLPGHLMACKQGFSLLCSLPRIPHESALSGPQGPQTWFNPPSPALTVLDVLKMPRTQTASSMRRGLGPTQLIRRCRIGEGRRMHHHSY